MAAAENDRRTKIDHPETAYAKPEDVLKDESLSAEEKKEALENWRHDIVDEISAADEGMPAPDAEIDEADKELQEVAKAERQLGKGNSK